MGVSESVRGLCSERGMVTVLLEGSTPLKFHIWGLYFHAWSSGGLCMFRSA